jgi:hypothetical protein
VAVGSPAPTAAPSSLGPVEIIGLLFLTVGSLLLPIFGPIIGLIFVAASNRWTVREKVLAVAILIIVFSLVPVLGLLRVGSGNL